MLRVDKGLRLTISLLLSTISRHCVAPKMPDNGGGAEADRVSGVLQAPADVDIIAGRAINRVKAPELQQCIAPEGHVAARNVLRNLVADQYMGRPAGCHRNRSRDEIILGRWEIGSATGYQATHLHLGDEV